MCIKKTLLLPICIFVIIINLSAQVNTSTDYVKMGNQSHAAGNYNEAIKYFNQAIALDSTNRDAFYYRGHAKFELADDEGAILDFTKTIQLGSFADAYFFRGRSKYFIADYSGSLADINTAIEMDRLHYRSQTRHASDVYYYRSLVNYSLKDFQGALSDGNVAIELDSTYADAYYGRAKAKYTLSDFDGAIDDCNKSIQLDQQYPDPYYLLGLIEIYQGKSEAACKNFSKAQDLGHASAADQKAKHCK